MDAIFNMYPGSIGYVSKLGTGYVCPRRDRGVSGNSAPKESLIKRTRDEMQSIEPSQSKTGNSLRKYNSLSVLMTSLHGSQNC